MKESGSAIEKIKKLESNIESLKSSMEEEVSRELKSIDQKQKDSLSQISKEIHDLKSTIEKQKSKIT